MPELDIQGILDALHREGVEFLMQWIGDDPLWEKLSPTAVEAEIGGMALKVVDYDGLVALKESAGRPQDLIDLARLREARGD